MRWPLVWRSTYESHIRVREIMLAAHKEAIANWEVEIPEVKRMIAAGEITDKVMVQAMTELMQLRRSSQIDLDGFRDDPKAHYIEFDNAQASEVKFRQVKTVNVELRGIIGDAAKSLRRMSNEPDVMDYADRLERFA